MADWRSGRQMAVAMLACAGLWGGIGGLAGAATVGASDLAVYGQGTAGLAPGLTMDAATRQALSRDTMPTKEGRRQKTVGTKPAGSIGVAKGLVRAKASALTRGKAKAAASAQHDGFSRLGRQTEASGGLQAYFDRHAGTPSYLKGVLSEAPLTTATLGGVDKTRLARAFLRDNRALLKLSDPDQEMALVREDSDSTGRRHFFFEQRYAGLPVWGKQAVVHLDSANRVYMFNGRYVPSITGLDVTPRITVAEAEAAVAAHLGKAALAKVTTEPVVYISQGGEALPVFKLDVNPSLDQRWLYFVDVRNGAIVHRINNIHHAGSVVSASGTDLLGSVGSFNAWSQSGNYYLIDPTLPTAAIPPDPLAEASAVGDTYVLSANNGEGDSLYFLTSTSATSGWDATGVSAMVNTREVYDYYLNTHARHSLDGKDKNLMTVVHFKNQYNNAFWNGTFMVYGDGDNSLFGPLAKCLDVAAHEMTHGVIENSANLAYENQSGALNESFADVFGAMVDRDDWLMGEDCTVAAPGYLRDMENPAQGLSAQPTKMSEFEHLPNTEAGDYGGVHVNSGIPNRAAYLVADGLSAEGLGTSIGRTKLEKIWYKALTEYLTASSNFLDARRATIQAAEDLYGAGAAEALAVAAAWDAVEVLEAGGGTPDDPSPTPTDEVVGDDWMVYLYPVDGSHDQADEDLYDVYVQTFHNGETEDIGPWNTEVYAAYTKPVAVTDEYGSYVIFVGGDYNLWMVEDGFENTQITDTGDIWSIAMSPGGRYFAYTTTDPNDINIHLIDLETFAETDFPLFSPDYQEGDVQTVNTIYYADSLAFDYTGKLIVFDALNCLSTPDNACNAEQTGGYRYWSIGLLEITAGAQAYPIPSQNPAIDVAYPAFAANNNYVIALDVQDYSDSPTGTSQVLAIDFENQQINEIYDFGAGSYWGVPSFWGDDQAVTVQAPTGDGAVISAFSVPLNSDWSGNAAAGEFVQPYAVAMPVMHRAGQRVLSGTLMSSAASLGFGNVTVGTQKTLSLTLSNAGNRDVLISNVQLSGAAFAHNGSNTRLPRGASMQITITFTAGTTAGGQSGSFVITSDGDPGTITVPLSATVVSADTGDGDTGSGGGGGGCSLVAGTGPGDHALALLLGALVLGLTRCRRT